MRWRLAALWVGLFLCSAGIAADQFNVHFDPKTDFSAFRTFAMRDGTVTSLRPELDNPLFVKKLRTTIRAALIARGLKETTDRPDLLVDYTVTGEDVSIGVPTPSRNMGPQPHRFTEGMLVIDLTKFADTVPVWRGVYRDDENTGSRLVQKLPEDAKKLIAKYPPRSK